MDSDRVVTLNRYITDNNTPIFLPRPREPFNLAKAARPSPLFSLKKESHIVKIVPCAVFSDMLVKT
jgi:hypothetical protein